MDSKDKDTNYREIDGDLVYKDETKLVPIGNSKGVRLPANLLKKVLQAEIGLEFDLEVIQKYGLFSILLTPKIAIITKEDQE